MLIIKQSAGTDLESGFGDCSNDFRTNGSEGMRRWFILPRRAPADELHALGDDDGPRIIDQEMDVVRLGSYDLIALSWNLEL
jgi:hypothetical protein